VAVARDGEIVAGGADGKAYFLSAKGEVRGDVQASPTPLIAVAVSPDGKLVAAGFSSNGSYFNFGLVRYTDTGSVDTGYKPGTVSTAAGASAT